MFSFYTVTKKIMFYTSFNKLQEKDKKKGKRYC